MNLSKSGLVMGNAAFLADLLCSKVGSFPGINLGMPLGSVYKLQQFRML